MSDILERLRTGSTDGTALRWSVTPVHIEAADEIEKLRAERDEAVQRGDDWCDQAQKARAELRDVMEWVRLLEDSGRARTDEVERLRGELRKIARGAFTALGDGDDQHL